MYYFSALSKIYYLLSMDVLDNIGFRFSIRWWHVNSILVQFIIPSALFPICQLLLFNVFYVLHTNILWLLFISYHILSWISFFRHRICSNYILTESNINFCFKPSSTNRLNLYNINYNIFVTSNVTYYFYIFVTSNVIFLILFIL